ncbi:MAG: hypothetical protein IT534_04950 [Bauldia sp.]|nr:hypothetical protein [Bauldia sp.]
MLAPANPNSCRIAMPTPPNKPFHRPAAGALAALALGASATGAAAASAPRTFRDVTPAIFECVKATSEAQHGTIYDSADGLTGTATTSSSLYTVRMSFAFDPAAGSLAYTLVSKSLIVPASAVWSGIETALTGCR